MWMCGRRRSSLVQKHPEAPANVWCPKKKKQLRRVGLGDLSVRCRLQSEGNTPNGLAWLFSVVTCLLRYRHPRHPCLTQVPQKICKTKQALMICGIDTATICTAIEVHKLDHLQIFAIICGTECHNCTTVQRAARAQRPLSRTATAEPPQFLLDPHTAEGEEAQRLSLVRPLRPEYL